MNCLYVEVICVVVVVLYSVYGILLCNNCVNLCTGDLFCILLSLRHASNLNLRVFGFVCMCLCVCVCMCVCCVCVLFVCQHETSRLSTDGFS